MPEHREEQEGFTESIFSDGGISHQVFRSGTGPAGALRVSNDPARPAERVATLRRDTAPATGTKEL